MRDLSELPIILTIIDMKEVVIEVQVGILHNHLCHKDRIYIYRSFPP